MPEKRKRSKAPADVAPPAARRFYAQALTQAEREAMESAFGVEGLDEEVALLRLRLRALLQERPQDLALLFRGIELLAKVTAVRYRLSRRSERDLAESIAAVVRGFGEVWQEAAGGA